MAHFRKVTSITLFFKGPLTWFDDSSKIWKLIGVVSYGSRKEETKIENKTRT